MSEEQNPQTSQEECSTIDFPEFEDEERWLFKVLGIKPRPSSALGNRTESFLCLQDILQENKTNSTDDDYACQAARTEDDDDEASHSDSDMDDNVKVIIGSIKTNPSMYMYVIFFDNAMNPTD
uniref:Testis specific X-linked gene n=1 Tax=Cricetulus griseus TaxID=10029 RepID=A0A8C2LI02_CRIGR